MTKDDRELIHKMNAKELKEYFHQKELESTATIGFLIDYLKKNFNPTDKVCYMDCVECVKNDCTYVEKNQLGNRFFRYVKADKQWNIDERHMTKKQADEFFPYVEDDDVIVC